MYKRWFMKIAYSDYPGTGFGYALTIYKMRRVILTTFLLVFPIYFLITIYAIPELTEYDLVARITATVFLLWFLFFYFATVWWFWYKRKCDKVACREDVRKVKKTMKKMIKLSPYYVLVHVLCLLLLNGLLLTYVKLELIVIAVLFIGDIMAIYGISTAWIRMVTYPLRSHIIREILESQKTA